MRRKLDILCDGCGIRIGELTKFGLKDLREQKILKKYCRGLCDKCKKKK